MIVKEKIGRGFFDLIKGDTLIENEHIKDGSVDLILTDLPYGNMNTDGGRKIGINGWDFAIEPEKVYSIANRILRKNGKMILFSQEPYTSQMITKAIPNIPFSYRVTWEKDNFAVALGANVNMVSFTEDVLIFSKSSEAIAPHDYELKHPQRDYFKKVFEFIGGTKKSIIEKIGQKADHTFRFNSTQYGLCTEKTYLEIIKVFNINKMQGFKGFDVLKIENDNFKKGEEAERLDYLEKHNQKYPSTFNLWECKKYKSNILKYKKDYTGHHPTQKPVLLLEDLIKTFSNEGDLVVDLTAGSFSTGVACVHTNRNFIGIEQDDKYYEIGQTRINNAKNNLFHSGK